MQSDKIIMGFCMNFPFRGGNMNDKRFNICILAATITDLFSGDLVRGAISAARRLDVNLTVMPGKYLGIQDLFNKYDAFYEYQYGVLFNYAAEAKFDYIIAPVGTIAYAYNKELKKQFLDTFAGTPVLCVAADIDGYDCLGFDNRSGIEKAIDYLAGEGKKHIGILAGNAKNSECIERYEAYMAGLKRNGLEFKESYLMYCDMSYECKKEAELLVEQNPELDAIICINDVIASIAYNVIKERGKKVGSDIAVVGFDDQDFAKKLDPPLASVKADAYSLGIASVERAYNYLAGIKDERHLVETTFIARESCFGKDHNSAGTSLCGNDAGVIDASPQMFTGHTHLENIFIRDSLMFGGDLKKSYADILKRLVDIGALTSYLYILEKPIVHEYGKDYPKDVNWLFKSYSYGQDSANIPESAQKIKTPEVFDNIVLVNDRARILIAADLFSAETQYGLALLEPADDEFINELELITYQLSSAVRTLDILGDLKKLLTDTRLALAMVNDYNYIYSIDKATGSYLEYARDKMDNDFSVTNKGSNFFADFAKNCRANVFKEDQPLFWNMFDRESFLERIDSGDLFNFDFRIAKSEALIYYRLKTIIGKDENAGTVFIGLTNIDRQKKRELAMQAEMFRDSLTGVKNKSAYKDTERKFDSFITEGICEEFSVFVFDLNDLKVVNDTLGHDAGDRYLQMGCSLICQAFKHSPVFRIGGDEFVAILKGSDYKDRKDLKAALKERIEANNQSGGVVMAVGSADYQPDIDICVLDVFKRADREMYTDKRRLKELKKLHNQ